MIVTWTKRSPVVSLGAMKELIVFRIFCGLFIGAIGFYLAFSIGSVPWWLGGAQGLVGLAMAVEAILSFRRPTKRTKD